MKENPKYRETKLADYLDLAKPKDIHFFVEVVGCQVLEYLNEHNLDLYVSQYSKFNPACRIQIPGTLVQRRNTIARAFYTFKDGYCVALNPHITKAKDSYFPNDRYANIKILDPWFCPIDLAERTLLARTRDEQKTILKEWKTTYLTTGIDSLYPGKEQMQIFRFMRDLIRTVSEDTIVTIRPSDSQRHRIYKKAFRDNKNIYVDSVFKTYKNLNR